MIEIYECMKKIYEYIMNKIKIILLAFIIVFSLISLIIYILPKA